MQRKWDGADAAEAGARPRLRQQTWPTSSDFVEAARVSWRGRRRGERDSFSTTFEANMHVGLDM